MCLYYCCMFVELIFVVFQFKFNNSNPASSPSLKYTHNHIVSNRKSSTTPIPINPNPISNSFPVPIKAHQTPIITPRNNLYVDLNGKRKKLNNIFTPFTILSSSTGLPSHPPFTIPINISKT